MAKKGGKKEVVGGIWKSLYRSMCLKVLGMVSRIGCIQASPRVAIANELRLSRSIWPDNSV
jgi:hypothetical protein